MDKRGIFGGTFNPVHWGHLLIAETALTQMQLSQVMWVPTRCPPHKPAAQWKQRVEMVQQAIAGHPAFTLASESANSYASETLLALKASYPDTLWYWIIGLDAFQKLPRWYRRQEVISECKWLVAPRLLATTCQLKLSDEIVTQSQSLCTQVEQQLATEGISICWQLLPTPWIGISSSLIRQHCRDRYSIRYLVPEPVRSYIIAANLYSD